MSARRPLVLITNDDGIHSPGLLAAAQAVGDLGETLVIAPKHQQTASSRRYSTEITGAIHEENLVVDGRRVAALSIDGSPAQAVQYGVLDVAARRPALVVSGINFGENVGVGITVSGTVGAAIEAAALGIPALAVSQETFLQYHHNPSDAVDFSVAGFFTRLFARRLLAVALPPDVDLLKVNVPQGATERTPWRVARVSRQAYYRTTPSGRRALGEQRRLGYTIRIDDDTLEPDSDIAAVARERVVSVVPISIDLTSRVDLATVDQLLRAG